MKKLNVVLLLIIALSIVGFTHRIFSESRYTAGLEPVRVTVSRFTPVIDPGHGGMDGGAVSPSGLHESLINLDISLKTELMFRFLGVSPVMTRSTDISLDSGGSTVREKKRSDLINRTAFVNSVENGFLISIHQNMFEQSKYYGAQMFHNGKPDSTELAELLQRTVAAKLDPSNGRQIKRANDIYLMENAKCNAVLVECGFLSNERECALLATPSYQLKLAIIISGVYTEWQNTKGSL